MAILTTYRLQGTDVILQDYEDGKGKIILSNDDYDYNLSYYWGSMGQGYNLSKFILKTNDGYLINKLGQRSNDGPINMKKTMSGVRKYIREETDWKWYYNKEADKELRDSLNNIQRCSGCHNEFIDLMQSLDVDFPKEGYKYHLYEDEFKNMIESLRCEPWYFILNDEPHVNVWLSKFIPELRKLLNKEINKISDKMKTKEEVQTPTKEQISKA